MVQLARRLALNLNYVHVSLDAEVLQLNAVQVSPAQLHAAQFDFLIKLLDTWLAYQASELNVTFKDA